MSLGWIQDSITIPETTALYGLRYIPWFSPELTEKIVDKPWVSDGITRDEATAVISLYRMIWHPDQPDQQAIDAAEWILSMPFLDDVDGADAQAVRSLRRLKRADREAFFDMLSHPELADGISDDETNIVALLGATYQYRPESVDFLLRGTGVYLEERLLDLPSTGDTMVAIVRIRDQQTKSMDYLEHSVRTIEEFMAEPLPTSFIALFYDDAVFPESGGTNFGTHMAMQLLYDVENGRWWNSTANVIAHEVAHYYWRGSQDWIDEGAADFLASVSEHRRIDEPIQTTNNPCASAKTISELEALDPEDLQEKGFNCNYYLGEAIFLDIYHTLGEDTFKLGFRNLYRKSLYDDPADNCEDTHLGICHLVSAFKADVSDDDAAKVDEVVSRWYGPLP